MNDRLRDLIEWETFLFGGVPENKRRNQQSKPIEEADGEPIGQINIDFVTGEITYIESRKETK